MRHGWVLAIALVSCGVTYVKGPDGKSDWFKVECRREAVCMKKALAKCPKGFLLAESESGSSTFYDKAPGDAEDNEGKLHDLLARCGKEDEEAHSDEDEPFKPIAKPKNLAACGRAYDKFDELSSSWLEWHPSADAAEKPPNRAEFINVCGDLSETAQICLQVKYGRAHQEECSDAFDELQPKMKIRLARLFEKDAEHPAKMIPQKAPPPADADSGAPPVDAGPADAAPEDAGKKGPAPKPGKAPKGGAKPAPVKDAGSDTGASAAGAPDAATE